MSIKLTKDLTFETALKELEDITRSLEEGKESLEKSMELYERGILLKTFCESKLKEAEGKWSILRKKTNGEIEAEDIKKNHFDDSEENSSDNTQGSIF
ncbi:MAG: exodeoxyribonuclease VII small subunit [Spirochaetia bacterium]|nr:exodeoxyribonuclease VII small subunit [Spirochaetia bacterium]